MGRPNISSEVKYSFCRINASTYCRDIRWKGGFTQLINPVAGHKGLVHEGTRVPRKLVYHGFLSARETQDLTEHA